MRLLGKILYNIVATSVSIVSGLLRNKIIALFLTVNLFGILSIGQQSASLLFTVFAFGIPLGITTFIAGVVHKESSEQTLAVSRIAVLAFAISLLFGVLLLLVLRWNADGIARLVTGSDQYTVPISIVILSAPFMVFQNCLFAVMEGMGLVKEIVRFKIVPAVIILPLLWFLCSNFFLVGAASGLLLNEILMSVVAFILMRRRIAFSFAMLNISRIFVKIFKVALLSFIIGAGWLGVDFLVKRALLAMLGEENNGIIQSIAKIVDLYPAIALSWLTMHLFPAISKLEDRTEIMRVIQRTMLVALSLIVPMIIVLFLGRETILHIVYKEDFVVGVHYFGAMLVVGIPRVYAWVLGLALLPLGWQNKWFLSGIIVIAVYPLGVWLGLQSGLSLYSIPVAYGSALAVQIVYMVAVYRRAGFPIERSFGYQSTLLLLMTLGIFASLWWEPILGVTAVLYVVFVLRYNLLQDIRERFRDVRGKIIK